LLSETFPLNLHLLKYYKSSLKKCPCILYHLSD
jgi:hypothetical protein